MERRVFIATAAAAGFAGTLRAAASELEDKIAALLSKHKVPAVSFAVLENGALVSSEAFGLRWADGPAVDIGTRFQAASLSKTINALGVLTLVRDGKLDLDGPVNSYLRNWQLEGPHAGKVTIAHLLSHTGATNVHGFAGYNLQPLPSLTQILNGTAPANSEAVVNTGRPGQVVTYSGGGTTVLQQVVEDVGGTSYSTCIEERVLAPLGMTNSFIRIATEQDTGTCAAGHSIVLDVLGYNDYPELAAAGLWTTPVDLSKALLAIMASYSGDAGALLPQALGQRMLAAVKDNAALGTFLAGRGRFSHDGVNLGFRATYVGNVASGSGYAIMSNGESGAELNADVATVIRAERGW